MHLRESIRPGMVRRAPSGMPADSGESGVAGSSVSRPVRMRRRRTIRPAAACTPGFSAGRCRCGDAPGRSGITLLEVLISVAIFMASLSVILSILDIGRRSELGARLQTEAVMRCEAKMAEVVAGIETATSVKEQAFLDSDDGSWTWSLTVADSGTTGLLKVTVTTQHSAGGEQPNASWILVRYMRDPQLFIDAALSESSE